MKPSGLWSRPLVPSAVGRAAELAAPPDQRVFQQAAGLEVVQQPGDRQIDFAGVLLVAVLQVGVLVPLHLAVAVRDLNEPHARLGEAAGHQAHAAEVRGDGIVEAVQLAASPPIRRDRSSTFGSSDLHAERQLERVDARFQRRLGAGLRQMLAVQLRSSRSSCSR